MATAKQIELFARLVTDRELGPLSEMPALRDRFATLTDKNASSWIERALDKAKRPESDAPPEEPAPF